MWLLVLLGLACRGGSSSERQEASPHPRFARVVTAPSDPHGDWTVTWDRSWAGWWPTTFNGRMVLGDADVAMTFEESAATFILDSYEVDGSTVVVEAHTT